MENRTPINGDLAAKAHKLEERLRSLGKVAVAFSAGVDSTLLLKVAHETIGNDVLAVTAQSPSIPAREIDAARAFCDTEGIAHVVIETHEFDIPGFTENPPNRCYLCKREILGRICAAAHERGFSTVIEGSNASDAADYRPGERAVSEAGVESPLRDAGFSKADVRAYARQLELDVWDKLAFACLNTRFAFGDTITPEKLAQVDVAEEALRSLGFAQVRVRSHDDIARIEVPADDIVRLAEPDMREVVTSKLKEAGFTYVSLDLQGYRLGSMNEALGE